MSRRLGKRLKVPTPSPFGVFVLDPNDGCCVGIRLTGGATPAPGDKVLRQYFHTPVQAQRFCTARNAALAAMTPEQRAEGIAQVLAASEASQ